MDPAAIAARLAKLKKERAAKSATPPPTDASAGQLSGRGSPAPATPTVPAVPDVKRTGSPAPAVPTVPTVPSGSSSPAPASPPPAHPVATLPAFGAPAFGAPAFGAPMGGMMPGHAMGFGAPHGYSMTHVVQPEAPEPREKKELDKKVLRVGGDGKIWADPSLADWPDDDYRLWVGNLGNDTSTEMLQREFAHFPSFLMARVIRNQKTEKTKGYGFVSFKKPEDCLQALRQMNGKHIGNRPCVCKKSKWGEKGADDAAAATKQFYNQKSKQRKKYHTGTAETPSERYKPY